MGRNTLKLTILAGASAVVLAACGGGSSSTPPPVSSTPPPAPVSTSGKVTGPISGFGSVIVNGETYNTDNASFVIEGQAGSQSDLKIGQIVTLKTSTDAQGNKSASEVSFEDAVQGRITDISATNNRFTVLGQTVIVRAATSFDEEIDPASIEGLAIDDYVQISGHVNGGGNIVASQIEKVDDETESFELTGTVSALNSGLMSFKIRGQDIDFSNAALEGFGENEISNGNLVEVKGSSFTNGVFVAENVEFKERDAANEDEGEIYGIITEFTSAQDFMVGETAIITNDATQFERCQASDLAIDVAVEVEGDFNDEGVLVADRVKCDIEADIEVESTVDSVDVDAGTLTVFGVTFVADMSTRFQDKTDTPVTNFNLADLGVGEYVEVKAYERADMSLYAVKIERNDPEDQASLQAPVEAVGENSLTLLGIDVETNEDTVYEDSANMPLSAEDFFGAVMVGDLVEAEGTRTESDSLIANEIEFEADD